MRSRLRVLFSEAWVTSAGLVCFFMAGILLFWYSLTRWQTGEYQAVWDIQWLNAWLLVLPAVLFVLWRRRNDARLRSWLILLCFSLWGFVAVSVVFHGTPFSWNGYWGDQKFRQAMILKFMTFLVPRDFYYKDLPPYYPPLYYYLLSWYGRVFSVEYYKLLKIGTQLIYLLGPTLLFILWRQVVSRHQAVVITLATFVVGGLYYHLPLSVPHEFLSGVVFIPWWLRYVEGLGRPCTAWRRYLAGGVIGGAVFMTYYYVFFIGGLLVLVRFGHWLVRRGCRPPSRFRPGQTFGMLAAVALFSVPYWLPLLLTMLTVGNHPSQREWFHLYYAELHFVFLRFSVPGLLALASIYYLYRRRSTAIARSVLGLIGAAVGLYGLGYLLGNLGQPILYIKAGEFMFVLAGSMIGFMVAGLLRAERRKGLTRGALGLLTLILMVVLVQDFTSLPKVREVETARKSGPQEFGTDPEEMAARAGSVFLTTHETFASFFPVFQFNAINQHYAHFASRYLERHNFLYLLQVVDDARLFHLALRHNKYDQVDYFMPREVDGNVEVWSNLSRYPDRFVDRTLRYSQEFVDDTALFRRETGDLLYQVLASTPPAEVGGYTRAYASGRDSLLTAYELYLLSRHLDSTGGRLLMEYASLDTIAWKRLEFTGSGDSLVVYGDGRLIPVGDSLLLLTAFQARRTVRTDYKIFLHLYRRGGAAGFDNYDYLPPVATSRWQLRDIVVCSRMLPSDPDYARLRIGFFLGGTRLGDGWWSKIPSR